MLVDKKSSDTPMIIVVLVSLAAVIALINSATVIRVLVKLAADVVVD